MNHERGSSHDPRIAAALEELTRLIRDRYPAATFEVSEGEDPDGVYLLATVDIDDPDDVTDLVIDRTLQLQIDEQLPVYVVPVRPISRVMDARRRRPDAAPLLPASPSLSG